MENEIYTKTITIIRHSNNVDNFTKSTYTHSLQKQHVPTLTSVYLLVACSPVFAEVQKYLRIVNTSFKSKFDIKL